MGNVIMFSASRITIEAVFWIGLLVIVWVLFPIGSYFSTSIAAFVDWAAFGLASIAVLTAIRVKRQLRRRFLREDQQMRLSQMNSVRFRNFLRDYGVREFGAIYLYIPKSESGRHEAARAWIETLDVEGFIQAKPWHILAKHVKETVRESHPQLFEDTPEQFDVYRLNWNALSELIGDDLP